MTACSDALLRGMSAQWQVQVSLLSEDVFFWMVTRLEKSHPKTSNLTVQQSDETHTRRRNMSLPLERNFFFFLSWSKPSQRACHLFLFSSLVHECHASDDNLDQILSHQEDLIETLRNENAALLHIISDMREGICSFLDRSDQKWTDVPSRHAVCCCFLFPAFH